MKQTAVEWLVEQIFNEIDLKDSILRLAIQQAKEMEKEQICNAWFGGYLNGECKTELKSEQYYNENFKNK
jgi:DNA polymerase III psi subunit